MTLTTHRHDRKITQDKAVAALTGLALGDALGMPTQSMSRQQIIEDYGDLTDWSTPAQGSPSR